MTSREHLARALWTLIEPLHALNYFSPEARQAFADVGLSRFWDGYFAGRAAPLGAVTAAPVVAMFSGFSPFLVGRALPAVWAVTTPEAALEARLVGAEGALRRILTPAGVDDAHVARAADTLTEVASRIDSAGTIARPLAAANAAQPVPDDPYRRLWSATSTLREHRGDGHVLALATRDIAGLSTIVLRAAVDLDAQTMKGARGWTDDDWAAEQERLTARGLLQPGGRISGWGRAALNRAEDDTNRLAVRPWEHLSEEAIADIARLLLPLSRACAVTYPQPNPIGMPLPWDADADPEALGVPAAPA
ncbi:hypothetical protein AX769_05045 [Frondihabitans sp. PAMC 28766]|uniref:SCO6745 family protein n=1 Tax=Frondihabitans sp. PAMC 28766 TaxID=1795630 RepID=UPI00078C4C23|nr:hypothetical protein [Frondihabitans sp. PAMC 28766]AMM19622.1 hypothetical protein AX769_05045 [Frondihabitans sp. PAMC 28766]